MNTMMSETRLKVFKRSHYMCEHEGCNRRATEVAHKIANTKENIKMVQRILSEQYNIDASMDYVKKKFIDSIHNLAASCREHNDYFNCGYNMAKVYEIIAKCKEEL